MVIDNAEDLDGLPDEEIRQAALLAESEGEEGKWVFKPTRVSMYPFLTYATLWDLSEELYNSYIQSGDNDNDFDIKARDAFVAEYDKNNEVVARRFLCMLID